MGFAHGDKTEEAKTTRASANDAGCWIDGHWGQYAVARSIDLAGDYGWSDEAVGLARKHLASASPSHGDDLTDDEAESLFQAGDDAEAWLTENVAPEGYSFGWYDGEFFLQSTEWWEETA